MSQSNVSFQIVHWNGVDCGYKPEADEHNACFDEERQYTVYACGRNAQGEGVTLKTTFDPYFFIKLSRTNPYDDTPWDDKQIESLKNVQLISKGACDANGKISAGKPRFYIVDSDVKPAAFVSMPSALVDWEQVWLRDLDAGFTGIEPKLFQFVKVTFKTYAAFQACARRVTNKTVTEELAKYGLVISAYEANLDPFIRLMHLTQVESAGWVTVNAGNYKFATERESTTPIEVHVAHWQHLEPPAKELANTIAPIRSASFDLEMYVPRLGGPKGLCPPN